MFAYALRPLFFKPKALEFWDLCNAAVCVLSDLIIYYTCGWKALVYLFWGTMMTGGLHPLAGHFISEHYTFIKGQETYSYYGPLNFLVYNVGYHNEHHDFPKVGPMAGLGFRV